MSAKPQPMAGQSDAADDLIAELAKLMAQDANGDRPAEVATPAFTVRIPGGDNAPAPGPVPRFDFDRTIALAAEQPKPAAAAPKAPEAPASEPFHFDFDIGSPKREPAAATPDQAAAEPVEPAMAVESTVDHDSIADLIAAELSAQPAPIAEPAVEPAPIPAAPVAPRATPQSTTNWAPTAVAANLGGQEQPARPALRALNLQPTPKPEQDRFKVPPVFGLGTKPTPEVAKPASPEPAASVTAAPASPSAPAPAPVLHQPAPAVEMPSEPRPKDGDFGRDPIDEIEDLIGRAMRVEFDKPAEPAAPAVNERPAPSPALRTLATPVAPVPATAQPAAAQASAPRTLSGADEAILAAAQATGAEIGWVEAPEVDQSEPVAPAAKQRSRRSIGMSRAIAGPLVAVTLLLAAGFGLYWVLGLGRDSGPAPLLTADASPIKETPAAQPDATAAQQSVVFNEIDGVVPGAEEQLVSRDQADVNEVTQVPPAADLSEEGLANRKVRTVTVRPDGTIVSGDDSVAGSSILPVDRPVVPEVPGAETASPELLASAVPDTTTPAAATTPAVTPAPETATTTPEVTAPATTATPVVPGSTVPAVDAAGNLLAGKTAPVPLQRPAGLVQSTAPTAAATAPATATDAAATSGNLLPPPPTTSTLGALPAAQPATTTQPEAVAAQPTPTESAAIPGAVEVEALPNSAPAYAQLASLRTEEEARQAAQALVARFGPLFGGANMEVQRVDLGARGIYYRVRVPADSAQAASGICNNVIAAGGDCVLM